MNQGPVTHRHRRAVLAAVGTLLASWVAACTVAVPSPGAATSHAAAPSGSPAPAPKPSSLPAGGVTHSLVVLGDSWAHGAHCNGCTPWPRLLAADYASSTGLDFTLDDLTENGGTSGSLVEELEHEPRYRAAVAGADVVVVNMGINDLERTTDPARLSATWTRNFGVLLDVVHELHAGRPVAVRMVGVSNEYLSDAGLRRALAGSGPAVFGGFNRVSCDVASRHGARCLDLRPVLNGPDGAHPADPDSQESMDAVARAVVDVGLTELGVVDSPRPGRPRP